MNRNIWKYYDFNKNWESFILIWKNDDVQVFLERAFNFYNITYQRRMPLWLVNSSTMEYVAQMKTLDEIYKNNILSSFEKRMAAIFNKKYTLGKSTYYMQTCFHELCKFNLPQKDTIESFIFPDGEKIISCALAEVARIIFNEDNVYVTLDLDKKNIILIQSQKIVFDVYGYYWNEELQDDDYYEELCDEMTSFTSLSEEFDDYDY